LLLLILLLVAGSNATAESSKERSLALARKELARSLDVEGGGIRVLKARPVEWPDTSLGCPEKGMTYAPVITPGHLVHLWAKGSTYAVHVGGERAVVCRLPERGRPARDGKRRRGLDLIQRARTDLEKRLEVQGGQVRLIELIRESWPDTSLGCPEPGEEYVEVPTEGIQIELAALEQRHLYRSDWERLVYCGRQDAPANE